MSDLLRSVQVGCSRFSRCCHLIIDLSFHLAMEVRPAWDEARWDEKAGLLYLLRFERVDNLGAYRIPPETGLLIPSGYVNYHIRRRR